MESEFILGDVLENLRYFQPIVIYINGKLLWDDNKSVEDWISYEEALNQYSGGLQKPVRRVDVKVVDFHHSIIEIFTTEF